MQTDCSACSGKQLNQGQDSRLKLRLAAPHDNFPAAPRKVVWYKSPHTLTYKSSWESDRYAHALDGTVVDVGGYDLAL
jgi:hypothetical protein